MLRGDDAQRLASREQPVSELLVLGSAWTPSSSAYVTGVRWASRRAEAMIRIKRSLPVGVSSAATALPSARTPSSTTSPAASVRGRLTTGIPFAAGAAETKWAGVADGAAAGAAQLAVSSIGKMRPSHARAPYHAASHPHVPQIPLPSGARARDAESSGAPRSARRGNTLAAGGALPHRHGARPASAHPNRRKAAQGCLRFGRNVRISRMFADLRVPVERTSVEVLTVDGKRHTLTVFDVRPASASRASSSRPSPSFQPRRERLAVVRARRVVALSARAPSRLPESDGRRCPRPAQRSRPRARRQASKGSSASCLGGLVATRRLFERIRRAASAVLRRPRHPRRRSATCSSWRRSRDHALGAAAAALRGGAGGVRPAPVAGEAPMLRMPGESCASTCRRYAGGHAPPDLRRHERPQRRVFQEKLEVDFAFALDDDAALPRQRVRAEPRRGRRVPLDPDEDPALRRPRPAAGAAHAARGRRRASCSSPARPAAASRRRSPR